MTGSRPSIPAALHTTFGATSSATPRAIENRPRPLASLSWLDCERPRSAVLGTTLGMEGSVHSRFQHHLDASVLLVAEGLVHLGSSFERFGMGNDERRID